MKRTGWRRPSPALVIACLALFVALGGSVLAATGIDGRRIRVESLPGNRIAVRSLPGNRLKKGSIPGNRVKKGTLPGNRVKKGTLPGNRLRPGTIPGNRIAKRSLKGAQIDVGTLGEVPSAAHANAADSARHARTAAAADHAADATTVNGHAVGCTTGRRQFAGACWDLRPSTTQVNALEATEACAARGGELPDILQYFVFIHQRGVTISTAGEWTGPANVFGTDSWNLPVITNGSHFEMTPPTFLNYFRCVTPFLR